MRVLAGWNPATATVQRRALCLSSRRPPASGWRCASDRRLSGTQKCRRTAASNDSLRLDPESLVCSPTQRSRAGVGNARAQSLEPADTVGSGIWAQRSERPGQSPCIARQQHRVELPESVGNLAKCVSIRSRTLLRGRSSGHTGERPESTCQQVDRPRTEDATVTTTRKDTSGCWPTLCSRSTRRSREQKISNVQVFEGSGAHPTLCGPLLTTFSNAYLRRNQLFEPADSYTVLHTADRIGRMCDVR